MPTYYYEYAIPKSTDYDPQEARSNRTNPDSYSVVMSGTTYCQIESTAEKVIKQDLIQPAYPEYKNGFGLMMFTELPDERSESTFSFNNSDWKERLERAVKNPDDTIIIDLDKE